MMGQLGPGKGKDFDHSNAMGPCLVTADEIGNVYDLTMICRVNGEEWGRGHTSEMHWKFEDCIAVLMATAIGGNHHRIDYLIAPGRARQRLIYQSWAYDAHNVGTTPGFNGDYKKALRSIKAKVLIMAGTGDPLNPAYEALGRHQTTRGRSAHICSSRHVRFQAVVALKRLPVAPANCKQSGDPS